MRPLTCVAIMLGLYVCCPPAAQAASLASLSTRTVEAGRIGDACLSSDELLYLCYPDAGYVAQYAADGRLVQFIRREAGIKRAFRPTSCFVGDRGRLHVFDEASAEVLVIDSDGNQYSSFPLAYPVGGQALALSRIGHLLPSSNGAWVLLPDRSELARFDNKGLRQEALKLSELLPYPAASYSRAQLLSDGTLMLLDYNQGAVLYRNSGVTNFRRLGLDKPAVIDGLPAVQDFAADERGNILLLTGDSAGTALLLSRGPSGYRSSSVQLPAALRGKRLACRPGSKGFIVWARDGGIVWLCEAR